MNIHKFAQKKQSGEKISFLTCYDYTFAKILSESDIDAILVGDSVAMVVHGYETTVSATIEMMASHTAAVKRGAPNKFIVADMPFLSFRKSIDSSIEAAGKLMRAGASAVKMEGVDGNLDLINHLINSGIPVMGHIGLTPQFFNVLGGNRVQGREESANKKLVEQAKKLEEAGCFSIVVECVPSPVVKEICEAISIPVIGIGAGVDADGQVLVLYDMLGMLPELNLKFVRRYLEGAELVKKAVNEYVKDIKDKSFPNEEESFLK